MEEQNTKKLQVPKKKTFLKLTDRTKFVYMCIKYALFIEGQDNGSPAKATITTDYLSNRFGISDKTVTKALNTLADANYIKYKYGNKKENEGFIVQTVPLQWGEKFEMIENIFMVTPCMTPEQKVFLALFYMVIRCDHKQKIYTTTKNQKQIIEKMEKDYGISESVTKRRIRELSKENIPVITKEKKGYSINQDIILGMYRLNSLQWESAIKRSMVNQEPIQAPIYKKDNVKLYKWDEDKQRIIKTNSNE